MYFDIESEQMQYRRIRKNIFVLLKATALYASHQTGTT